MKLYYTKRSPYARKVRVVAIEKGIALDFVEEDLAKKSKFLLGNNPIGRIPTLVLESGQSLTDSSLIIEYLETVVKEPSLLPQDLEEAMKIKNLDMVSKGLMDVTVSVFYETLRHPKDPHQSFLQEQEQKIKMCLAFFEKNIACLETFSLASVGIGCAIGYLVFRLGNLWPQKECPHLEKWYQEILKRRSFQETQPIL